MKSTVYLSILLQRARFIVFLFIRDCSKRSSDEAAADGNTAGVALGYLENVVEVRTKLGTVLSSR